MKSIDMNILMKSIDVKSLIIGILGTALVLILMGFSFTPKYQLNCGRYDQMDTFRGGKCALLNTRTGVVKLLLAAPGISGYSSADQILKDELREFTLVYGRKPDF